MTKILSVEERATMFKEFYCECNGSMTSDAIYATTHRIITEDRLALLQALYDELEGKKIKQKETETWDTELKTIVYGRRLEIQDQQDNLQALMDSIRV